MLWRRCGGVCSTMVSFSAAHSSLRLQRKRPVLTTTSIQNNSVQNNANQSSSPLGQVTDAYVVSPRMSNNLVKTSETHSHTHTHRHITVIYLPPRSIFIGNLHSAKGTMRVQQKWIFNTNTSLPVTRWANPSGFPKMRLVGNASMYFSSLR